MHVGFLAVLGGGLVVGGLVRTCDDAAHLGRPSQLDLRVEVDPVQSDRLRLSAEVDGVPRPVPELDLPGYRAFFVGYGDAATLYLVADDHILRGGDDADFATLMTALDAGQQPLDAARFARLYHAFYNQEGLPPLGGSSAEQSDAGVVYRFDARKVLVRSDGSVDHRRRPSR